MHCQAQDHHGATPVILAASQHPELSLLSCVIDAILLMFHVTKSLDAAFVLTSKIFRSSEVYTVVLTVHGLVKTVHAWRQLAVSL